MVTTTYFIQFTSGESLEVEADGEYLFNDSRLVLYKPGKGTDPARNPPLSNFVLYDIPAFNVLWLKVGDSGVITNGN